MIGLLYLVLAGTLNLCLYILYGDASFAFSARGLAALGSNLFLAGCFWPMLVPGPGGHAPNMLTRQFVAGSFLLGSLLWQLRLDWIPASWAEAMTIIAIGAFFAIEIALLAARAAQATADDGGDLADGARALDQALVPALVVLGAAQATPLVSDLERLQRRARSRTLPAGTLSRPEVAARIADLRNLTAAHAPLDTIRLAATDLVASLSKE